MTDLLKELFASVEQPLDKLNVTGTIRQAYFSTPSVAQWVDSIPTWLPVRTLEALSSADEQRLENADLRNSPENLDIIARASPVEGPQTSYAYLSPGRSSTQTLGGGAFELQEGDSFPVMSGCGCSTYVSAQHRDTLRAFLTEFKATMDRHNWTVLYASNSLGYEVEGDAPFVDMPDAARTFRSELANDLNLLAGEMGMCIRVVNRNREDMKISGAHAAESARLLPPGAWTGDLSEGQLVLYEHGADGVVYRRRTITSPSYSGKKVVAALAESA